MKRRKFLQVAGVTGAGLAAGCGSGEPDRWMPYLVPDDDLVPGIPTWYASTCKECPAGCGILVKTREGRPIKIEGNPQHPVNRGRLCARGQAALQGLYDPDRVTQPMQKDRTGQWKPISWDDALAQVATALGTAATAGQDRVLLLTGGGSGPLDKLSDDWIKSFRSTRRVRYEVFAHEPLREAAKATFGQSAVPAHDFAAAKYVLSFGADFLETWLSPTGNAVGFAESHGYNDGRMSKFVAVEPRRGMTGYSADEWVAPKPGTEHLVALAIAHAIIAQGKSRASGGDADMLRGFLTRFDSKSVAAQSGVAEAIIERLATEFTAESPSLAVAGGIANRHEQATQLAVAVNLLNYIAGNVGKTVTFPSAPAWDGLSGFRQVMTQVEAMRTGAVDVALVHGANPAYSLPQGAKFAEAFAKVGLKVSLSMTLDETAQLCDLILPDHHALESWDIVEPVSGVKGIVQPTIRPLADTRQTFDVLLALAQQARRHAAPAGVTDARTMVAKNTPALERTLQRGGTWTAAAARSVRLTREFARLTYQPANFAGATDGLVLLAVPSPMLYDGRGANKPVLQEIPDPATKITWQTWVEVHPATAVRLGLRSGDVVDATAGALTARAIVYVYPGVRPDVVAMPIGRGHTAYGRYARGIGSNPLGLLAATPDSAGGLVFAQTKVTLAKTGSTEPLATTEGSSRQMGRGIARLTPRREAGNGEEAETLTRAEKAAIAAATASQGARTNVEIYAKANSKWEMTIDLSRCTGCSACVAACYAENNIPTVGAGQVVRSREMAWIRLERYFEGDTDGTDWQVAQLPMLCQQCANAPCEPVCPVYAAYHTPDGLNGQIYNRCVGTRYCANNCPYKVRYFNWWDYGDIESEQFAFPGTLQLSLNPDVTVRTKGVMEKCTFCVSRIRFAQNDARVRGIELGDGAVTPACAQTCPSGAIVFGNANDAASRVSRSKRDARGYLVFEQLNTKPGVTYLARVVDTHSAAGEG
jgi:anaerobic selenocysteine-containing dehydrogenase/Fe-S-cluster-containing dehydrogenase component